MITNTSTMNLTGVHESPAAERVDELVREFFDAVNADDAARVDAVLARNALSYDRHGTWSRTGLKQYYSGLRRSFSDLRFEVHENVGVLIEGDLAAVRTIITGTHTGDYAGTAKTGTTIQTSASHIFRIQDSQIVEHWQVVDTYRILAAIGAIPGVANIFQREVLRVAESPGGLFQERPGTEFAAPGTATSTAQSRAIVRRLYNGVIATGDPAQSEMVADDYIQNSGWTPDGRDAFVSALTISRGAMPDGRALQVHMVAEHNRVGSLSVWDGTLTGSGDPVDFMTLDFFRIENGVIAEHWESVDWVPAYQSFGLLAKDVHDA